MDKENKEEKCLPCTHCEPTQVALLECSANQNRKCGCGTGTFLEPSFLICVKCKKCPRGEGVESNCSGSSDTKCAPCLEVSFFFEQCSSRSVIVVRNVRPIIQYEASVVSNAFSRFFQRI